MQKIFHLFGIFCLMVKKLCLVVLFRNREFNNWSEKHRGIFQAQAIAKDVKFLFFATLCVHADRSKKAEEQ